jgi:hypothetical protein
VVIKIFFLVLILCTAAVVAVILAIHFRVKKHLRQEAAPPSGFGPDNAGDETGEPVKRPQLNGGAQDSAEESHPTKSS